MNDVFISKTVYSQTVELPCSFLIDARNFPSKHIFLNVLCKRCPFTAKRGPFSPNFEGGDRFVSPPLIINENSCLNAKDQFSIEILEVIRKNLN